MLGTILSRLQEDERHMTLEIREFTKIVRSAIGTERIRLATQLSCLITARARIEEAIANLLAILQYEPT